MIQTRIKNRTKLYMTFMTCWIQYFFIYTCTTSSTSNKLLFVNAILHVDLKSSQSTCLILPLPSNQISILSGTYQLLNDNISPDPIQVLIFSEANNEIVYNTVPQDENENENESISNNNNQQQQNKNKRKSWNASSSSSSLSSSSSFRIEGRGRHEICIGNGAHVPSMLSNDRYPLTLNQYPPTHNDGLDRTIGFTFHIQPYHERRDTTTTTTTTKGENFGIGPVTEVVSSTNKLSQQILDNLYQLQDHMEYVKEREHLHRTIVENIFERLWKWTLLEIIVLICISVVQVLYFMSFFGSKLSAVV